MQREEHTKLSRALLEASDRSFASGDRIQGSQELWGAATHAVMSVVSQLGWKWDMEELLKETVAILAIELEDPFLGDGFDSAVKFHHNFYDGEMEDREIEAEYPKVHQFVNALLPTVKASGPKVG